MYELNGDLKVKIRAIQILMTSALVLAQTSVSVEAHAGIGDFFGSSPKSQSGPVYQVNFPDRMIVVTKNASGYVVEEQSANTRAGIPLFEVGEIRSVTRFKDMPAQTKFAEYVAKDSDGTLESPATWLMIGTDQGYQFLRRRFKNKDLQKGSMFHVFSMQGSGHQPKKVSSNMINDPVSGMHFIFSLQEADGSGYTIVVRESDLHETLLARKYIDLGTAEKNRLQISNESIQFKDGEVFKLALPPINIAHLSNKSLVSANAKSAEEATSTTTDVLPQAPHQAAAAVKMDSPPSQNVQVVPQTSSSRFMYADYNFVLSIETGAQQGTYLTREADGLRIKISDEALSREHQNVKFEEGIFSFSKARKIDLDAFSIEAGMHWVPAKEEPKPQLTPEQQAEANKLQVSASPPSANFEDYREEVRTHIKPIPVREGLISSIIQNLSLKKYSSTILTGESGDIRDILDEAIERLPRTWQILELDSATFGAGLGMSGAKEEKILEMEKLSQKEITIFFAEDFETMKGLGAVQGDSRDALTLLRKPLRNGKIKIIGTGRDDFKKKVGDPTIIQAMQVIQVDALTQQQVVEAITRWMHAQPKFAEFDYSQIEHIGALNFNPISYAMQTTQIYNPAEMEPNRTIKLLEKLNGTVTRISIELAAREAYQLDPSITDRKAKKRKLKELLANLNQRIMGHSHLKKNLYDQTDTFLTMQHNRRGPGVRLWLEGPVGVGKTELAVEYARAMGLEHTVIAMGTIESTDQLMERIRTQLDTHPFSVIILDEADKLKDKTAFASMLTMMNQETFTYTDKENKTFTMSAANAKIVVTSNLTDDLVTEFYATLSDQDKDQDESVLAKLFFERFPITMIVDHMVNKGMPRPFIDRFATVENGISYAFPPSTQVMEQLLMLKLKSGHRNVEYSWSVEVLLKKSVEFCAKLATKYREQNLSTRTTLGELDSEVNRLRGEIYKDDDLYAPGRRYELDLTTGHYNHLSCESLFN